MSVKILYDKRFQRIEDTGDALGDIGTPSNDAFISDNDRLHKRCSETIYVIMPERIEMQKVFMDAAIVFSEYYMIDLQITEHSDRLSAVFTIPWAANLPRIKELIQMADDISFSSGPGEGEMQVAVDYYTHLVL